MNAKQTWNRQQIEEHLQSAITELTPDIWDRLELELPQQESCQLNTQGKQKLDQKEKANLIWPFFRKTGNLAAAACLGIVLAGGGYYYEFRQIVTVVGLDVNPSIEFSLNRRDRVVESRAVNEDGQAVISKQEVKGRKLEEAVDSVITRMADEGYLKKNKEQKSTVLVTVASKKKEDKKEKLRQTISSNVEISLASNEIEAVVYEQTVTADEAARQEVLEIAEEYQISQGKASFIQSLVEENESVSIEDVPQLAMMTMGEISEQIDEHAYQLKHEVKVTSVTEETIRQVKDSRMPDGDSMTAEVQYAEEDRIPKPEEMVVAPLEGGEQESLAEPEKSEEPEKFAEPEKLPENVETMPIRPEKTELPELKETEAKETEAKETEAEETEAKETEAEETEAEETEPEKIESEEAEETEAEETESEEAEETKAEETKAGETEPEETAKPETEMKPAGVRRPETIWTDSEPIETREQEAIRIDEETPAVINRDRAHKILEELKEKEWIWKDDIVSGMLPGPGTVQWGCDTEWEKNTPEFCGPGKVCTKKSLKN